MHVPLLSPNRFPARSPVRSWAPCLVRGLALCLALCLPVLGACSSAQQRGVVGNAYVSTSRPAMAVHVKVLPPVTSGRGTGTLYRPNAMGALTLTVRTAVFGNERALATVTHAELPDASWIWTSIWSPPGASKVHTEVIDGVNLQAFTWLVPMDSDPYAGLVGDPVEASEAEQKTSGPGKRDSGPRYWLARQFVLRTNFNRDKIILEYREPAPREWVEKGRDLTSVPFGKADELAAFEQRAREAFSLGSPEDVSKGAPLSVENGYPVGVRWSRMTDLYLGDVMYQEPLTRF